MMRTMYLAAVASMAFLALPAAVQARSQGGAASQSNVQAQQGKLQSQNQVDAQQPMSPAQLDRARVKQIQQALDQKGFNAGKTDGIWGPKSRSALRQFQRNKNLQANGKVDQSTLSALGVQFAGNQQGPGNSANPPSTTGSGSNSGARSGRSPMNPPGNGASRSSSQPAQK